MCWTVAGGGGDGVCWDTKCSLMEDKVSVSGWICIVEYIQCDL